MVQDFRRSCAKTHSVGCLTMSFPSILFERPEDFIHEQQLDAPVFFVDLNLDQIIAAITAGREEYNLKPFFYYPLNRTDAIEYRHEIMQDLENAALFEHVKSFSQKMRTVREHLAQADKSSLQLSERSMVFGRSGDLLRCRQLLCR